MKKLTYSLLLLMLLTSVPALADYAPVNVQTALKRCILPPRMLPGHGMRLTM